MFVIDTAILIGSVLLLLGIVSSKFSARLGMPVLVMFLGLGMLAGSEGVGGIAFEDYSLAYAVGTLSLALILFSGGLSTPFDAVRECWKSAGILATWGVFCTAVITGMATAWILDIPLVQGLLLGSIVGSTDAAAVFSILRNGGVHIRRRLAYTLEVESGSNDPMAIFMTVGLIEVLTGHRSPGWGLAALFVTQIGIGLAVGLAVGYLAVWVIRHIHLGATGLYPILASAFGLLAFGLAADLGGSGFLSVYLAGLVIGNHRIVFQGGIILFHDAAAWLAQIVMFIVLGLLSFPSRLLAVFLPGLAIAAVLILVARPLAVGLSLFRSPFNIRELLFLSWVGLKGAVPITLAIFPLMAGIGGSDAVFDIVFFVVLVSVVLQGWSLPWVVRKLGLEVPPKQEPPITLELTSLHDVEGDIVDYFVDFDSRAAGKCVKELALPEEALVALLVRNQQMQLPKGSSRIEPGDHLILVLRPDMRPMVDRVFARPGRATELKPWPTALEFPLRADIRLRDLEQFYDIQLGGNSELSLDEWMRQRLHPQPVAVGVSVDGAQVRLCVREIDEHGRIKFLGMSFLPSEQPTPAMEPTDQGDGRSNAPQSAESPDAEPGT